MPGATSTLRLFSDDNEKSDDFEEFHISSERKKKKIPDFLTYANRIPSESVSILKEVDIEEVFNIYNETLIVIH